MEGISGWKMEPKNKERFSCMKGDYPYYNFSHQCWSVETHTDQSL